MVLTEEERKLRKKERNKKYYKNKTDEMMEIEKVHEKKVPEKVSEKVAEKATEKPVEKQDDYEVIDESYINDIVESRVNEKLNFFLQNLKVPQKNVVQVAQPQPQPMSVTPQPVVAQTPQMESFTTSIMKDTIKTIVQFAIPTVLLGGMSLLTPKPGQRPQPSQQQNSYYQNFPNF
jgi:hypothetical protein